LELNSFLVSCFVSNNSLKETNKLWSASYANSKGANTS